MKLYATASSERASKGQGGNRKLEVVFTAGDERVQIARIYIEPHEFDEDKYILTSDILGEKGTVHVLDLKGKKQEGEKTGACGIPGHGTYCRTCFK